MYSDIHCSLSGGDGDSLVESWKGQLLYLLLNAGGQYVRHLRNQWLISRLSHQHCSMDLKSVSCPLSVLQTKDNRAKGFLHALIFTVNTSEKKHETAVYPQVQPHVASSCFWDWLWIRRWMTEAPGWLAAGWLGRNVCSVPLVYVLISMDCWRLREMHWNAVNMQLQSGCARSDCCHTIQPSVFSMHRLIHLVGLWILTLQPTSCSGLSKF